MAEDVLLSVSDLHVEYRGGSKALNGVSFDVAPGDALAIVGPNGAGKTTLVRALGGLSTFVGARITSGKISFDGHNVTRLSAWGRVRRGLHVVPERRQVFSSLTVAEHFRLMGIPMNSLESLPDQLADLVHGLVGVRAGDLSGGQRQLLAVICPVLQRPKLLVVDECSMGLAPTAIRAVVEAIRWARETERIALIVVEQSVAVAKELAPNACVLRDGRLMWFGTSDGLSVEVAVEGYIGSRST